MIHKIHKMNVSVENGKYTVKQDENGHLHALRHGVAWRNLCGDNLVYALAAEVETLRQKIKDARDCLEDTSKTTTELTKKIGERMSDFYKRLKNNLLDLEKQQGLRSNIVLCVSDLRDMMRHFDSMEHDLREIKTRSILKTKEEIQSNHDRQQWAEGLISQLPVAHDGRNSWLLNFGISAESIVIRAEHPNKPRWVDKYRAAETFDASVDK